MRERSFWLGPQGLSILGLAGFAAYWLITGHRQHLVELLPLLLLLICPAMHLFGHGHHGHRHGGEGETAEEAYRRGLEEGRTAGDTTSNHPSKRS